MYIIYIAIRDDNKSISRRKCFSTVKNYMERILMGFVGRSLSAKYLAH